jgi:glutamate/tyrosine decarboxylase-like PLP-dependent enzyme
MTFPRAFDPLLASVFDANRRWEAEWPPFEPDESLGLTLEAWAPHVEELSRRLRVNYPHFHPLYAGQMLKPPHPAAIAGYVAAMLVNPNNHALDGGRATAAMEKEAIVALARMFGLVSDGFLGHLTSSGTIANLEALWVARELHPDLPIVTSSEAHYTHKRMCALLRAPCIELPATLDGRLDLAELDALLAKQKIGTVVVTLGTTGLGILDPLPEVLERRRAHGFRVHVDAAYGGYFRLLADRHPELLPLTATSEVDSIVIDPHKHGLQPYGCGCVLFADGNVATLYAHDSPYTYFSSPEHHPGETTLECSRAGAAAAALWLTLQGLPLEPGGAMSRILERCLDAARALEKALPGSGYVVHVPPTLDIVTYFPKRPSASAISRATEHVFAEAERTSAPLYLAKLTVDGDRFARLHPEVEMDAAAVTVLRSCLMRPEQKAWVGRITAQLANLNRGAPEYTQAY